MKKRILIPRVRLNEAYDGPKHPVGPRSRFDLGDYEEIYRDDAEKARELNQNKEVEGAEQDVRDTIVAIESFLNHKFGGVRFKVVERANESVLSHDMVDLVIVPEITEPLNVTYVIDDVDKEIQGDKVVLPDYINPMKLWPLVIDAAKKADPQAPDYIKAIHKVS
jgi:hypothetical protein